MRPTMPSCSVFHIVSFTILSVFLAQISMADIYSGGTTHRIWHTDSAIYSSPAIDRDGTIYVGASSGRLYAFDPSGPTARVWHTEGNTPHKSCPVIGADGTIYIGTAVGALYAFNQNGTTNRIYRTDIITDSSPAVSRNGIIYIHAGSGQSLYALLPNGTTNRIWQLGNFSGSYSSPSIAPDGTIYVGSDDTTFPPRAFYALDPNGPTCRIWSANSYIQSCSPAIGPDGAIYVGTFSQNFYSYNPNGTTNRIWTVASGADASPAIGTNPLIYVGDRSGNLYAFNTNGSTNWVVTLSGTKITSSPALDANNVCYIAYTNGIVAAISSTGSVICAWHLEGEVHSSPTIGRDGTIYIGSTAGKLYALRGQGAPLLNSTWPKYRCNLENTGGGLLVPQNFSASKDIAGAILLGWSAVPYAQGYEVWSCSSDSLALATLKTTVTGTNYLDTNITMNTTNYYWIRATNEYVASSFTVSDYGYAASGPIPVPSAPANVAATKGTYTNKVLVAWTSVSNAIGYIVWRSGTNDTNSAEIISGAITATSYADTNLIHGSTNFYWVMAYNAYGFSPFSSSDSGWLAEILTGVSADFDGDGKADPAVYIESIGMWKVKLSSANYTLITTTMNGLGGPGYASAVADYDADGKADPAIYNEEFGSWIILLSTMNYQLPILISQPLGGQGFSSIPADYDGDLKADPCVYERNTGNWQVMLSTSGYSILPLNALLGGAGFRAVSADYDGDLKADPAIYGENSGYWIFKLSSMGYVISYMQQTLGGAGYSPVPADYDGDAKADPAVINEAGNEWTVMFSSSGYAPTTININFE